MLHYVTWHLLDISLKFCWCNFPHVLLFLRILHHCIHSSYIWCVGYKLISLQTINFIDWLKSTKHIMLDIHLLCKIWYWYLALNQTMVYMSCIKIQTKWETMCIRCYLKYRVSQKKITPYIHLGIHNFKNYYQNWTNQKDPYCAVNLLCKTCPTVNPFKPYLLLWIPVAKAYPIIYKDMIDYA